MKKIMIFTLSIISILLFSCSSGENGFSTDGDSNDNNQIPVIPERTKVAEQIDVQNIVKVEKVNNQERIIFSKETDLVKDLKDGDILIIPPDPNKVPYGMLRKVKSKTVNPDGTVVIETELAMLTEAIESGEVEGTVDLDLTQIQSQTLAKGVRVAKVDKNKIEYDIDTDIGSGLKLVGDISIEKPNLYFKLRISYFQLKEITAKIRASETARLQIIGNAKYSIKSEIKIASIDLPPIGFTIGPVPIIITPTIEVVAGANGSVSAKISTGVIQTLNYAIGATYTDTEGTKGINELTKSFKPSALDFEGKVNVHPYVKGGFYLKLYDVAGPGGAVEAYLDFDAKANPKITCSLDAGVESSFEIKGEVLSYAFVDIKVELFKEEINLAKCGPPQLTVSPKGIKQPSGFEGEQNFAPTDFIYTLDVKSSIISGNDTIDWEATSSVPWLTVSQTSGIVQKGSPQTVNVAINQTEASKLAKGEYTGFIEFKNKTNTNQPPLRLPVILYVKGKPAIKVSPNPSSIPLVKGDEGGPFNPSTVSFTITAEGGDVNWEVSKDVDWIDLSQTSGFIPEGGSVIVDATINQNANSLAPGGHRAVIEFKNVTKLPGGIISGQGNTKRNIFLNAKIYTYPSKLFFCAEKPGGNFIPSEQFFKIKSTKSSFDYNLAQTKKLVNFDKPTGNVPAKGEAKIKAEPSNFAKTLGEGSYETTIVVGNKNLPFSFQDNGISVTFDIGVRGCGRAFILANYNCISKFCKDISDAFGGYATSSIYTYSVFSNAISVFDQDGNIVFSKEYNIKQEPGINGSGGYIPEVYTIKVRQLSGTTTKQLLSLITGRDIFFENSSTAKTWRDGTLLYMLDENGNILWKKGFVKEKFVDIYSSVKQNFILYGGDKISEIDREGNLKMFSVIQPTTSSLLNDGKRGINFYGRNLIKINSGYIGTGTIGFYYFNPDNLSSYGYGIYIFYFDNTLNITSGKVILISKQHPYNLKIMTAKATPDGSLFILGAVNDIEPIIISVSPTGSINWIKKLVYSSTDGSKIYPYEIFLDSDNNLIISGAIIYPLPANTEITYTEYYRNAFPYNKYYIDGKGFVISYNIASNGINFSKLYKLKDYKAPYIDENGTTVITDVFSNLTNTTYAPKRGLISIGNIVANYYKYGYDVNYKTTIGNTLVLELNPDGSVGYGLPDGFCNFEIADFNVGLANVSYPLIQVINIGLSQSSSTPEYRDFVGEIQMQDNSNDIMSICEENN